MNFNLEIYIKEIFDIELSENELKSIEEYNSLIHSRVPDSKILSSDNNATALRIKSDISYIYYSVKQLGLSLSQTHDKEYNRRFSALSRLGRPSKAAIESEIYSSDSSLREMKGKLDKYYLILEYLESIVSILDGYIYMLNSRSYAL